jgi:hypothetical protein
MKKPEFFRRAGMAPPDNFRGEFGFQIARQQTINDGQRFLQPTFKAVAACAVADENLVVYVEGLRIAVGENVVLRKASRVVCADDF